MRGQKENGELNFFEILPVSIAISILPRHHTTAVYRLVRPRFLQRAIVLNRLAIAVVKIKTIILAFLSLSVSRNRLEAIEAFVYLNFRDNLRFRVTGNLPRKRLRMGF